MASFYRKEVFTFVDKMSPVLSSKISSLEDSFRPLIDVLDPNKTPSTDKVVKLVTVFPDDVPDSDALFAEIEVSFSHCDKEKAKIEEPFTLRDVADFAIECDRNHKLYPNVAKVYRLLLTSPPSVCKNERSLSRLKLLKNYLRSTISQDRLDALIATDSPRP